MKCFNTYIALIISILLLTVNGFTQSLSLSYDDEPIGDTLLVVGLTSDYEIVAHAIVTNNTGSEMDVKVQRTKLDVISGTLDYFCWGDNCYPPSLDESPTPFTIGAGQSTDELDFSAHYEPRDHFGDSFIEYKFFNANDEDENVKVVVQYAATTVGINEHDLNVNVYPNPASDQVNIALSCNMNKVSVYDYKGKLIRSTQVEDKKYRMNVSQLNPGIYILKIGIDDGVIVKQVIVN